MAGIRAASITHKTHSHSNFYFHPLQMPRHPFYVRRDLSTSDFTHPKSIPRHGCLVSIMCTKFGDPNFGRFWFVTLNLSKAYTHSYIHTYIHTYRQTDRQPVTLCAWLRVCSNICQLQRVSINPPPLVRPLYYLNNSVKNQPILIIFGIWHPEKTWHRKNINVPTSSTNSWRECKTVIFQLFSTMISNKQHHHSKTVKMTLY